MALSSCFRLARGIIPFPGGEGAPVAGGNGAGPARTYFHRDLPLVILPSLDTPSPVRRLHGVLSVSRGEGKGLQDLLRRLWELNLGQSKPEVRPGTGV